MELTHLFRRIPLFLLSLSFFCIACKPEGGKLAPQNFFEGKMLELSRAIVKNDKAGIEAAIRSGADPNGTGKQGMTPLLYAYGVGEKQAMITLLNMGADPNRRVNVQDAPESLMGRSAMTVVAGTPDNEYLKILLDYGGDVNAKDSDNEPILIAMVFTQPPNYEGINMLLDRGANIDATDSSGSSLIRVMARLSDFEHVYYLMQRGANFRKKDLKGSDLSFDVFQSKIDRLRFPREYEWQLKCQKFLLAHGIKDPGPRKTKTPDAKEQAERLRMYQEAQEADRRRHGY